MSTTWDHKTPGHESGAALLAYGPEVLHDYVATRCEAALGRSIPQMEVRVHNLCITADVVVIDADESKTELPTIWHTIKKTFVRLSATKHVLKKEIVRNVSAVFKPGTMTLVLGQPGSGKSSLLKVLGGRFPREKHVTITGDVTYNGVAQSDLLERLPQFVAYVTQRDRHFPALTVKETLEYAHRFCRGELSTRVEKKLTKGTAVENKAALDTVQALLAHYPEVVIQQLGLETCQDTIVGNGMIRGVSGGERKRVTTGEMEFGMKYVSLMDEISTGLDSAATYDIIKTKHSVAKKLQKTVVIALLQPGPEVFALFDNVILMNEGEIMYNGPREQVVDYFESLGFKCPAERDVADYLLDLGTNQQYKYESMLLTGMAHFPRLASEFAELYRQSSIYRNVLAALEAPHDPQLLENVGNDIDPMPEFHQSFWANTWTLMERQNKVTMRNTAFLKGRGIMVVVMGLVNASTFWNVDPTNVQVLLGVLFQAMLFLSLGQASQIPTFMYARDIFYKQRGANFYRSASYVLSCSVAQVPLAFMEAIVFGSLLYWMCGLVASTSAFIIYLIVLFLTNLTFASWFFFIASISPDLHVSKPIAMITILFFVLFAGFIVVKSQMPDWLVWIYWVDPFSWCLRGLAVNQYRSSAFEVCVYEGVDYCSEFGMYMGEYSLSLYEVPSEKSWTVYGIIFMIAAYVLFMFLGCLALEYKRYESPKHTLLTKKTVDDAGSYALVETPKKSTSRHVDETCFVEVKERTKNFTPVTVAFQDLWYSVPNTKSPKEALNLLKGVSGFAMPGSMTALMGSSGAGKTTLMDVIAGRKTGGTITGKLLLNGHEANDLAIRRCAGYCEQMDVHSEASTFREAFTFSAFLRQDSSVPDSTKLDSVHEVLDLLDMHDIADHIIRGSSVEQMKRLTIGVELAAQPSVIFLDEPTSGLDARSAKLIMDGVRKVADSGRTIVCTIHQPSSEVFYLFDNLLLLKRGGETVFFGELGEKCRKLINYFEAIPDVAPLPKGYNPATWMLEVIGAGVNHAAGSTDFVSLFKQSEEKHILDANLAKEGVTIPSPDYPEMMFTEKRAASSWTQARFLVGRFMNMYWRTPSYNLTRFIVTFLLALVFGLLFFDGDYQTYQGINGGAGMLFMTTVFNGIVSFNSVLPISCEERESFYRERAAQTYNALWYFVGSTLAEIPYVFASGFIFTFVWFFMVGFTGFGTALLYWINVSLLVLLQAYMGQFLAYAMPSVEVAAIIGVLMNSIFFLFMGFNPPANAIPGGYKWLYAITPQRYPLAILGSLVFGQCDVDPTWNESKKVYENVGSQLGCQPVTGLPVSINHITVKEYVGSVFGMHYSDMWTHFGYVFIFIAVFRLLALLSLRLFNHQKR
uniref:ABC transporter domain-containing protein n=1 Tax=Hyaloperonospora arabidopsidis (strain Emoy2) TaxID=559515 RepID=M4BGL5_HYAAE